MRIIKAFITALVLFAITVLGFTSYVNAAITSNTNDVDYYLSRKKYVSTDAIANNLTKHTALVLGSSELSRLYDTKFHPKQMVNAKDKSFMLVGEGYFQSLNHAIRIGALANDMENKKVNLIVSPQWFIPKGADPLAFTSRFSEDNLIHFLKNKHISKATKKKVMKRTQSLLVSDKVKQRIQKYEDVYLSNKASIVDSIYTSIYAPFMILKSNVSFLYDYKTSGIQKKVAKPVAKFTGIDEAALLKNANSIGKEKVNNDFNMDNSTFKRRFEFRVDRKKDSQTQDSYSQSPEYKDLQLFLDVCRENKLDVNLIMIPVNGEWYDHIGFTKEKREEYYNNIRRIANDNNVTLSDLSNHEYTKYFFMDATHYGWKGWVYVIEDILAFEK